MRGDNKGFTLIETLVAITIFVLLTLFIVNVFVLSLRAQRQTAARQQTLAEIRFFMDEMGRTIRSSQISFEGYDDDGATGINGVEQEVLLIDSEGNDVRYYAIDGQVYKETSGGVQPLTNPDKVSVYRLDFYISPEQNPFQEERCSASLNPTGCLAGATCTIDDSADRVGYCQCMTAFGPDHSRCASGYCGTDGICVPPDTQPNVTIVAEIAFVEGTNAPQPITMQTTVTSRIYKR